MFGPKLEARSYTTLLLIAVACLLTLNLTAQRNASDSEYSEAGASREVARSNQAIAEATREVARSNQAIADAIGDLADAVKSVGDKLDKDQSSTASASRESSEPASYEYQGKFELN